MSHLPEHDYIFDRLKKNLPVHLKYHSVDHTLDVYQAAQHIGIQEKISPAQMRLLLTAAAFHDSGYLFQAQGHESISCEIAREELGAFGYDKDEINIICDMIMSTKIPQQPKAFLAEILCDADLDYLGRPDFLILGENLFEEMLHLGSINGRNAWNELQIKFLSSHHFFTLTSKTIRQKLQDQHLEKLLSERP